MKNASRGHCAAFGQPGVEVAELTSQIKEGKKNNREKEDSPAFGACLCHPLRTAC